MPKRPIEVNDVPVNFLLTCSEATLASFQLACMNQAANLPKELTVIVERMVDESAKAALATWFRTADRGMLKRAIENPEDVVEWAREQIRNKGRKGGELLPMPSAEPGAAHRVAALQYQNQHIAAGKCRVCPRPLDRNSVRFCTAHLEQTRERQCAKSKKLNKPSHGRAPGTLAVLAKARGKQARKRDPVMTSEKETLCLQQT
jgi:hypothetical protein